MSRQPTIPEMLRFQAVWCERLGSPLYARLLARAATDAEEGGPVARVLGPRAGDAKESALPIRLMGAVNRLVLEGPSLIVCAARPPTLTRS